MLERGDCNKRESREQSFIADTCRAALAISPRRASSFTDDELILSREEKNRARARARREFNRSTRRRYIGFTFSRAFLFRAPR